MGERKFTFVEYHSHGSGPSFFPDLIGSREEATADTAEQPDETDDSGGNGLRILLALVVLVGVAVAIKYFMDDEEEQEAPVNRQEVAVTEFED